MNHRYDMIAENNEYIDKYINQQISKQMITLNRYINT